MPGLGLTPLASDMPVGNYSFSPDLFFCRNHPPIRIYLTAYLEATF